MSDRKLPPIELTEDQGEALLMTVHIGIAILCGASILEPVVACTLTENHSKLNDEAVKIIAKAIDPVRHEMALNYEAAMLRKN